MASLTNRYPCLQFNVPEWYRREDFLRYLCGGGRRRVATWHRGPRPNDYSDLFLWFDAADGPEHSDLPAEIAHELYRLCEEAGFKHGILWLTNLTP
jgi:hypothetical protein